MTARILGLFRTWDETLEIPPGSAIFAERDRADCMFLVLDGEVELTMGRKPLTVEGKGGVVGEMAMLGFKKRDGAATARGKVKLARIDEDSFRELMSRSTDFSLLVMRTLACRLRAADGLISDSSRPTPRRKALPKRTRQLKLQEIFTDTTDLEVYPAGAVILEQGTEGETMFVVVEGEVGISLKGRELAIALPGEIVGEMALLSSHPRSATVTALSDCKLAAIDQASFETLLRNVPHFASFVMTLMASRLRSACQMIEA